jgi:hypothetical protein
VKADFKLLSAEPKWRQVIRLTRQSIAKLGGCAATLFTDGRVAQPAMKCAIESVVFLSIAGISSLDFADESKT